MWWCTPVTITLRSRQAWATQQLPASKRDYCVIYKLKKASNISYSLTLSAMTCITCLGFLSQPHCGTWRSLCLILTGILSLMNVEVRPLYWSPTENGQCRHPLVPGSRNPIAPWRALCSWSPGNTFHCWWYKEPPQAPLLIWGHVRQGIPTSAGLFLKAPLSVHEGIAIPIPVSGFLSTHLKSTEKISLQQQPLGMQNSVLRLLTGYHPRQLTHMQQLRERR